MTDWLLVGIGSAVLGLGMVGAWHMALRTERNAWRRSAAKPDHVCTADGEDYFVMQAGRFFTEYHNPLVVYRRQARKMTPSPTPKG